MDAHFVMSSNKSLPQGSDACRGLSVLPETAPGEFPQRRAVVALVPAHNEEEAIASTLAGLMTQSRPPDRVIVVCDNCTDQTADLAALAGAEVLRTRTAWWLTPG